MPITPDQNAAIKEIITTIISQTAPRGKRQLAAMFMDLVDRRGWPHYYEVIPEPRCLKQIQSGVEKGRYKEATDVYTDLSLVFWNALYYNEDDSQIAADAKTLKNTLEAEWKKRSVLPNTRSSPPPSSAQKVHGGVETKGESGPTPAPPPAASTSQPQSQSQFAYTKPIPIRPKSSAQNQPTPDVEVDVVSQDSDEEGEGPSAPVERDPRSEEIVKQLEKGLPRFPGFGEEGWMDEVTPGRLSDIVHTIKSYKDVIGNRVATCLESLPEDSSPALYLSDTAPISLKQIETRTRHKMYKNAKDFDKDMMRLFEKARRWHEPGTEAYGRALLLQRLYQALTGPNPIAPPYVSSTNFASLRAGPGNVKPVHSQESDLPSVTVNRTLTKDRVFVDEVHFKGWRLGVADWVHLSNPDDPSRPIIGQVFKCWLSDEFDKKGNPGITVSWYYRPEQTFHPANRQFWANEVFKTGHYADHPVEDLIERIAVQFAARHIRGRPRPPIWYLGFPLYVCDSRYRDHERVFRKLKNWNQCVPDEVRGKEEWMQIYPFEKTVYPPTVPSPFVGKGSTKGGPGVSKYPGGLISATEKEKEKGEKAEGQGEASSSRKRPQNASLGATATANATANAAARASSSTPARTITSPATFATPTPVPYQQQQAAAYQPPAIPRPAGPDRSVITAAGGLAAIGGLEQVERLPPETTRLLDRDPDTNEVLWFAAPPMNTPRASGARHSLAYLEFIAAKRRKAAGKGEGDGEGMDVDGKGPAKRARVAVPPTVMETTRQVLQQMQQHQEQMAVDG